MSKFSHILPFIIFWCTLNTHAQSVEQEAEYANKICKKVKALQPRYQKLVVEQFKKNGDSTNVDDIDFLNIYTVYATRKAVKMQRRRFYSYSTDAPISRLLNWIDPLIPLEKENFLTYIDPKKIDCNHCFLYRDSTYIGLMSPYINHRSNWWFRKKFLNVDADEKVSLYKFATEVKPDVIFEVCRDFTYFFIKGQRIYATLYDSDRQTYSMITLKEYIDTVLKGISAPEEPFWGDNSIEFLSRKHISGVKYPVWESKQN